MPSPTQFNAARIASEKSREAKRERRYRSRMQRLDRVCEFLERPKTLLIVVLTAMAFALCCGAMIWRPLFG